MKAALARHDELTYSTVDEYHGRVFKHTGDGVAAVFDSAVAALGAACRIQEHLNEIDHEEIGPLSVRIGIHSGEAEERDGDYVGLCVSRAARLMSAGHGRQVLVSHATRRLVDGDDIFLRDLGEHRLRDLSQPERIFQLDYDQALMEFPPLRTVDAAPNNLPTLPSSFIGRDQELEEVTKLVRGSRLVTLTGVGGAGKTRIALQAAAQMSPEYRDGVWLVELAAITDPATVESAMLAALGIEQPSGVDPRDALMDQLKDKTALMIVDNCEHLLDAVAAVVHDLVSGIPRLSVVATSRELLGVPGEVTYRLRSMSLPDHDGGDTDLVGAADSVRLFVERGAASRPDYHLTSDDAHAVAEICRRLDGMPLAIELAAARLRSFSTSEIAEHLDQRFRLLTGGSRTALPRQQTLTATIEWSYRLLEGAEAMLLTRLSVFQEGFDFESVTEVCVGDPVDHLDVIELLPRLVDKSLVIAEDLDGHVRYRLLETIRQFARDRLDASGGGEVWRRRHAEWFAGFSAQVSPNKIASEEGQDLIRRLAREVGNLRQAMAWAIGAGEVETAIGALTVFVRTTSALGAGWSEPLGWAEQVYKRVDETVADHFRARILYLYGILLSFSGQLDRAIDLLDASVELHRRLDEDGADPALIPDFPLALNGLSLTILWNGGAGERNEVYTRYQNELLELARRRDDRLMVSLALANLAHHRDPEGDPDEARNLFEDAERATREVGSDSRLAGLAHQRAGFEWYHSDFEEAHRQLSTAEDLFGRLGPEDSLYGVRLFRIFCEAELGDVSRIDDYRATVTQLLDEENQSSLIEHQNLLAFGAGIDAALGRYERVATAVGASEAIAKDGHAMRLDAVPYVERITREAIDELGEQPFEEHKAEGTLMTPDEVTDFLLHI